MEAQLLRDMITDREKAIEKIKVKSLQQIDREQELKGQLIDVRKKVKDQEAGIRQEKMELLQDLKVAEEKLLALKLDFYRQGSSLRTYCHDVAVDKATDESYVMRMQAQLCKAMHSMGITDNQMELVQKQSDAIVKYQKEQLAKCTDQKTEAELKHMNDLMAKDIEKRESLSGLVEELERIQKEREGVERQLEENRDSDDESDAEQSDHDDNNDDESEDEEEREMKEELMKILAQKREEIDQLETKQEEQEEVIAEMEDQLAELQGLESPRNSAARKAPDAPPPPTPPADTDPSTSSSVEEESEDSSSEPPVEPLQEALECETDDTLAVKLDSPGEKKTDGLVEDIVESDG